MTTFHHLAAAGFAFGLGASVGSFLNVCIWRWPRGESVVHPPSHCPRCGTTISARDNVPLLSWLWLRGRCRECALPISIRYPMVEAAAGLFFAAIMLHETLSEPLDPLERGPVLVLFRLVFHWALAALFLTTALIEHDRRAMARGCNRPRLLASGVGGSTGLTLTDSNNLVMMALGLAATFACLPGDPIGAALNLGLLLVFIRSCE